MQEISTMQQVIAYPGKRCAAGRAIGQGNAIEQDSRGERTEQEVFHAGFPRSGALHDKTTQYIESQREHFQAQEDSQETGSSYHHHHTNRAEQHERVIFSLVKQVQAFQVGGREQNTQGARAQNNEISIKRSWIGTDHVVKSW